MTKAGPIRTCIGCRARRSQTELLRLHLDAENRLQVGRLGPGRGAWVCANSRADCFSLAVKIRAFGRAFRRAPSSGSVAVIAEEMQSSS